MSGRENKLRRRNEARKIADRPKARRPFVFGVSAGMIAVLGLAVYFVFFTGKPPAAGGGSHYAFTPTKSARKAKSLNELLSMTSAQLAEVDIAEMNLLCAAGLPGAEDLDIDHCLATLDKWAARVKVETERHLYRATDPRWARHYRNSEAYLRASFLLQVLQEDLGVKYDMTARGSFSFSDSRAVFLHGMIPAPGKAIAQTSGGTCVSMPVMYIAVGRRLGYPLKLVTTDSHLFIRWDGQGHPNPAWRERFNIEGSGRGFSSFADDYYMSWPVKQTARQVRANRHLVSLSPAEEFAQFLASRGHCAADNRRLSSTALCGQMLRKRLPPRPNPPVLFRMVRPDRHAMRIPPLDTAAGPTSRRPQTPIG